MIVNRFPTGTKIYTDQITKLTVNSVANTPGSLIVTWEEPTSKLYKGVTLVYKIGSYPISPADGYVIYVAKGTLTKTITGFTGGTTYYIRAFAKATNTSGTKVYYNVATAGAQATRVTAPSPVTAFAVAKVSSSSLSASWNAPSGAYSNVMVRYKTGGYPTSVSDGTQAYLGTGTSTTITGLTSGTTYYFRAFVVNSASEYNTNASQEAYNTTKVAAGQLVFTSSQTYTIPAGVSAIDVFTVGGGGGGGSLTIGSYTSNISGSGGGGGYTTTRLSQSVTPGQQISVVVGAGGAGSTQADVLGAQGGTSSFGSLCSALGGYGGLWQHSTDPDVRSNGGSGGGTSAYDSAAGGSDGGNGAHSANGRGVGQGVTTRAFATAGATLYAGGGGAGGYTQYDSGVDSFKTTYAGGVGGAGGGGAGGLYGSSAGSYSTGIGYKGADATSNTGGGGGGGCVSDRLNCAGNGGSGGSGIVIIRWAEQ